MKPKLNKITEALRPDGAQPDVIYGIDRTTIWINIAELPISEEELEAHCADIKVTLMQMPCNAQWKLKIVLLQPTRHCLRLLSDALGHDIAVLVSYVEIAFDMPATSAKQARLKMNSFLRSVKMRYQHHPVILDEHGTVFYFGRRTKKKGKKWVRCGHVIAAYADKPSKLLNAQPHEGSLPWAHVESRVSGSAALAEIGIVSLDDLIYFDHTAFWESHIQLFRLPLQKVVGYQLAKAVGASLDVSDAAFRKRAANWESDHSIQDAFGSNFILHNALREAPELCKAFQKMSFLAWLDELPW